MMDSPKLNPLLKLYEAINVDEGLVIMGGVKICLKECTIPNEMLAVETLRSPRI
jgi:hypothetical protein